MTGVIQSPTTVQIIVQRNLTRHRSITAIAVLAGYTFAPSFDTSTCSSYPRNPALSICRLWKLEHKPPSRLHERHITSDIRRECKHVVHRTRIHVYYQWPQILSTGGELRRQMVYRVPVNVECAWARYAVVDVYFTTQIELECGDEALQR